MVQRKKLLLLTGFFAFALLAKANTGKSVYPILHGYVMDAITKKPVAGVVVSASLPGANSVKEVRTDSDGYFHFTELPSALVNLQFDKKGYQPYKRNAVSIKEKTSIKLNIEFLPESEDPDAEDGEYPLLRVLKMN